MSERQFTMPASPAGIPGFTEWERALSAERGATRPPTPRPVAPEERGGFGRAVPGAAVGFVLGLGVGTAVILGTGLAGPAGPAGPGGPGGPAAPAVVAPAAPAAGPAAGPIAPAPPAPPA